MPVYFAQSVDGGPVKIGYSADVSTRIKQLEWHYDKPLAILAMMDGGRAEERAIHARFAHLRFGKSEQFRPDPELLSFIGRPLLASANPGAVEAMPRNDTDRRTVLTIKGTDTWKEWLEGLGKFLRTPASTVVDHALVRYAKEVGYKPEAPGR